MVRVQDIVGNQRICGKPFRFETNAPVVIFSLCVCRTWVKTASGIAGKTCKLRQERGRATVVSQKVARHERRKCRENICFSNCRASQQIQRIKIRDVWLAQSDEKRETKVTRNARAHFYTWLWYRSLLMRCKICLDIVHAYESWHRCGKAVVPQFSSRQ